MGEGARCGDVPAGIPPLHSRGITEEEGRVNERAVSGWPDVHFGVIKVKLADALCPSVSELGYRFPLRRGLCLRRQQLNNRHHRERRSVPVGSTPCCREGSEPGASSSASAELE